MHPYYSFLTNVLVSVQDINVDEHHATNVRASILTTHSNILDCIQDADVLDKHYIKNRRPWPHNALDLSAVRGHNNQSANADDDESDTSIKLHNKCYTNTPKSTQSTSLTQISFYLPKWKDFLEECKVEMRTYAMISDPWPYRRQLLNGFILDTINMTVVRWRRNKLSVEKGYYLEHKKVMGELVCISKYLCVGYAQVIHKMALLCPVSETEEKRLWARKFQLYKQKKQGKTM